MLLYCYKQIISRPSHTVGDVRVQPPTDEIILKKKFNRMRKFNVILRIQYYEKTK